MKDLLERYESYWKFRNDRGFTVQTVVKYLGNLNILFRELNVRTLADLDPKKINEHWLFNF